MVNHRQAASLDRAAARIELDPVSSDHAWFTIKPFYKLRRPGDPVLLHDKVCLAVTARPSPEAYLVASEASHPQNQQREVAAGPTRTRWRIELRRRQRSDQPDVLADGDVLRLCALGRRNRGVGGGGALPS